MGARLPRRARIVKRGLRDEERPDRFSWESGQATVRDEHGQEISAADILPLGEVPAEPVVTPEVDAEVAEMERLRLEGVLDEEAYGVDR